MISKEDLIVTKAINRQEGTDKKGKQTLLYIAISTVVMMIMLLSPGVNKEVYAATKGSINAPSFQDKVSAKNARAGYTEGSNYEKELNVAKQIDGYFRANYSFAGSKDGSVSSARDLNLISAYDQTGNKQKGFSALKKLGLGNKNISDMLNLGNEQIIQVGGTPEKVMGNIDPRTGNKTNNQTGETAKLATQGKLVNLYGRDKLAQGKADQKKGYTIWDASNDVGVFCVEEGAPFGGFGFWEGKGADGSLTKHSDGSDRSKPLTIDEIYANQIDKTVGGGPREPIEDFPLGGSLIRSMIKFFKGLFSDGGKKNLLLNIIDSAKAFVEKGVNHDPFTAEYSKEIKSSVLDSLKQRDNNAAGGVNLAPRRAEVKFDKNTDIVGKTGAFVLPSLAGLTIPPIVGELAYLPQIIPLVIPGMNNSVNVNAYFKPTSKEDVFPPYDQKGDTFVPTNGAVANGQSFTRALRIIAETPGLKDIDVLKMFDGQYTNPQAMAKYISPRIAYAASKFLPREYGVGNAKRLNHIIGGAIPNNLQDIANFNLNQLRDIEARTSGLYRNIMNSPLYNDLTSIFTGPHWGKNTIQSAIWSMSEISKNRGGTPPSGAIFAEANEFSNYYESLLRASKDNKLPEGEVSVFGDGYHADMIVHQNENFNEYDASQGRGKGAIIKQADEQRIIIKNPEIKYLPKIKAGDGVKNLEEAKKIKFDKNTQKWTIGPFKADYLDSAKKAKSTNNAKEYFATMTGIKLKGVYETQNGTGTGTLGAGSGINSVDDLLNSIMQNLPLSGLDLNLQGFEDLFAGGANTWNSFVSIFDPASYEPKKNGSQSNVSQTKEKAKINKRINDAIINYINLKESTWANTIMIREIINGTLEVKKKINGKETAEKINVYLNRLDPTRWDYEEYKDRISGDLVIDFEDITNNYFGTGVYAKNSEDIAIDKKIDFGKYPKKLNIKGSELIAAIEEIRSKLNAKYYNKAYSINSSIIKNFETEVLFTDFKSYSDTKSNKLDEQISDGLLDITNHIRKEVKKKFNYKRFGKNQQKEDQAHKLIRVEQAKTEAINSFDVSEHFAKQIIKSKHFEGIDDDDEEEKSFTPYRIQVESVLKNYFGLTGKYKFIDENNVQREAKELDLKEAAKTNLPDTENPFHAVVTEDNYHDLIFENSIFNQTQGYGVLTPLHNYFAEDGDPKKGRVNLNLYIKQRLTEVYSNLSRHENVGKSEFYKMIMAPFAPNLEGTLNFYKGNYGSLKGLLQQGNSRNKIDEEKRKRYIVNSLKSKYGYTMNSEWANEVSSEAVEPVKDVKEENLEDDSQLTSFLSGKLQEQIKGIVAQVKTGIYEAINGGAKSIAIGLMSLSPIPIGGILDGLVNDITKSITGQIMKLINANEIAQRIVKAFIDILPRELKIALENIVTFGQNFEAFISNVQNMTTQLAEGAGRFKDMLTIGDDIFGQITNTSGGILKNSEQLFVNPLKDLNPNKLIEELGTKVKLPNGKTALGGVIDEYNKPQMEMNPNKWYYTPEAAKGTTQRSEKNTVQSVEKKNKLQEIKSWRIKVKKDNKGEVRLPKPNENFVFEIDYDPALKSINKARFEFAYMIYGGYINQYQPYMNRVASAKVTKSLNEEDRADFQDTILSFPVLSIAASWFLQHPVDLPQRRLAGNFGHADLKVNAEYLTDTQTEQKITNIMSITWIEEIGVELEFKEKDTDTNLNLMIPIGGTVWEDKAGNANKNVGFDNVMGTDNDRPLKGIKVTVLRNLVKVDPSNPDKITNILKKERARLYKSPRGSAADVISSDNADRIFTDSNGSYGPFYIHDIGFTNDELEKFVMKGKLKEGDSKKLYKLLESYDIVYEVRFDYDGMVYEPVVPMQKPSVQTNINDPIATKNNVVNDLKTDINRPAAEKKLDYKYSSHAIEFKKFREDYNNENAVIGGRTQLKADLSTGGRVYNVNDNTKDKHIEYTGKNVGIGAEKANAESKNKGQLTMPIQQVESEFVTRVPEDYYKGTKTAIRTGGEKVPMYELFMSASTFNLGMQMPGNDKIVYSKEKTTVSKEGAIEEVEGTYFASKEFMKYINLGLRKRTPVNISVDHKLNEATAVINKKAFSLSNKDYDSSVVPPSERRALNVNIDGYGDIDLVNEKQNIQNPTKVRRYMDLYKMDYLYRTGIYKTQKEVHDEIQNEISNLDANKPGYKDDVDSRQLDVFFTYRTAITNDSPVDTVRINALDNYYNNMMEIVDTNVIKVIQEDPEVKAVSSGTAQDSIEDPGNGSIHLSNEDLVFNKPAYAINPNKNNPPLTEVDLMDAPKLNVDKLNEDLTNEFYKASRKLPKEGRDKDGNVISPGIDAIRISSANKQLVLGPDEVAEVYYTFRIKNADSLDSVIRNSGGNESVLGSLKEDRDKYPELSIPDPLSLGDFMTTAEVAMFTTYDHATGKTSGKFAESSAPDNVVVEELVDNSKIKRFEFDTSSAEIMHIKIAETDTGNERIMKGKLWEDKRNIVNNGVTTGDGRYDPAIEKGIPEFPITLEERITVAKGSGYEDIPFIWPDKIELKDDKLVIPSLKEITEFESTVKTFKENVEDDTKSGDYVYRGIPVGNMVVNLDYTTPKDKLSVYNKKVNRDTKEGAVRAIQNAELRPTDLIPTVVDDGIGRDVKYYNGADFKSTLFYEQSNSVTKPTVKGSARSNAEPINMDKTWVTKDMRSNTNLSLLRDDEFRRLEVTTDMRNMNNGIAKFVDMFRTPIENWYNIDMDSKDKDKKAISKSGVSSTVHDVLTEAHKLTSMKATTPKINFSIQDYEGADINTLESIAEKSGHTDLVKGKITIGSINRGLRVHNIPGLYIAKDEYESPEDTQRKYEIENINLGIVERPKPKQVLNKEITELKLTTADGNVPVNLKYKINTTFSKDEDINPIDVKYGESITGKTNITFERVLDKENSTGIESALELDRTGLTNGVVSDSSSNPKPGFKYINMDEKLLQDAVISVKYEIYAYNAGEVDRMIAVPNDKNYLKEVKEKLSLSRVPNAEEFSKYLENDTNLDNYRRMAYREGSSIKDSILKHQEKISVFGYGTFTGMEYYARIDGKAKGTSVVPADKMETHDAAGVKINKVLDRVDNDYNLNLSDEDNQDFVPVQDEDLVNLIQGINNAAQFTTDDKTRKADIKDGEGRSYIKRDKDGNPISTNLYMNKKYSEKLLPIHDLVSKKSGRKELKLSDINFDGNTNVDKSNVEISRDTIKIDGIDYVAKWTIKPTTILSTKKSKNSMVFENIVEILETTSDTGVPPGDTPGSLQPEIDHINHNGGGIIPGNEDVEVSYNPPVIPSGSTPDRNHYVTVRHEGSSTNEVVTLSPPTGLPAFVAAQSITTKITFAVIIVSLLTGLLAVKTEKRNARNNAKKRF